MIAFYHALSDKINNDLKRYDLDSQFCLLVLGFEIKEFVSDGKYKMSIKLN